MTLFYPRLDFAQNIEECLPLLYVGQPGHGQLRWTFDPAFSRCQAYEPDTNIVVTVLTLPDLALTLTLTDFCPPETTALVRRMRLENRGPEPFAGSLGHYFDLRLGEVYGKQAVGYSPEEGYFLQYFRGTAVAVGGSRPDVWRCGKSLAYDDRSAKKDLEDGHLSGQIEDIGRVNFAGLHHLNLAPGESWEGWLILSAGPSREEAVALLQRLQATGAQALQEETRRYWQSWLSRRRPVQVPGDIEAAYRRSLLALALLQDAGTGSFIAAPEFDPAYERCGGYGYCWPRDASESAGALAQAGYPEAHERLCEWYRLAQLPGGLWAQRHWGDGQVAASWALRPGFEQLDQTAAALCSLCEDILNARPEDQSRGLALSWETIARAAQGLQEQIGDDGLHHFACDLWETYCGVFLYTNAALARALTLAAQCARLAQRPALQQQWGETAEAMNATSLALFNGTYFPRGYRSDGDLDEVVDSSTLGLVEPWNLLSPHDPQQRQMILSNLQEIERRLSQPLEGGTGIRRFEGDTYLGGVVGCVNTLWMAQVTLRLAVAEKTADPAQAQIWHDQALGYIRLCLSRATVTGLLPELIGLQPDTPYWAVPHGWASGLLVRCAVLLDQLEPQ
jgi:oligosaccharide amylase